MPGKLLSLLFLLLLSSCSKQIKDGSISHLIEKNGISMKVSSSAKILRSCDLLEISFDLKYPNNLSVKTPSNESDYGDFNVYQIHPGSPVATNETENTLSMVAILEPGLPGQHRLPPLTFTFWNQHGEKSILQTKAVTIPVTSVIPESHDGKMEEIILTPKQTKSYLLYIVIAGSVALVLILLYLKFRAPKKEPETDKSELYINEFNKLKNLSPETIIADLHNSVCYIMREKFSLHNLPVDWQVIIRDMSSTGIKSDFSSRLEDAFLEYDSVRYSENTVSVEKAQTLWAQFDKLIGELNEVHS